MANTIIKESFKKVWEDIGRVTQRKIQKDFIRETGLGQTMFQYYKTGFRTIKEEMANKLEEIFDRYGYHDIWDK